MIRRLSIAGRAAVIGDVHGRLDLLEELLGRLGQRQIVHCGDLCDRGPESKGVVQRLMDAGAVGVRGNHEEWLIRWASGAGFDRFALHPGMGGKATLQSYGVDPDGSTGDIERSWRRVPQDQRLWLAALPLALLLEVGGQTWWVLHAGLPPQFDFTGVSSPAGLVPWLLKMQPDQMCWAKCWPGDSLPAEHPVIMGHVPMEEPLDAGHCVGVDTGAGTFGVRGRLTALLLPERRFVSVGPLGERG